MILAAADISNRKRAEEALRLEREQLLSIFDGIDQAISVIDPESHEVLYVNRYLRDLYGKDPVGEICHWAFHTRRSDCRLDPCTEVMEPRGAPHVWECDDPVLKRSFTVTDRAIRWPDGRMVKFTIAIDVTDRKRAEEQLREVIESSPVGIAILQAGELAYGNAALGEMIGCGPSGPVVGSPLGAFIAAKSGLRSYSRPWIGRRENSCPPTMKHGEGGRTGKHSIWGFGSRGLITEAVRLFWPS